MIISSCAAKLAASVWCILNIIVRIVKGTADRNTMVFASLLGVISIIGFVSNINSRLIGNIFPIIVDMVSLWKTFACFCFFERVCSNENRRSYIVHRLKFPAKAIIYLVVITSIVQQFVDIGTAGHNNTIVFGIKQYGFFWNNSINTGWLVFGSLLILAAAQEKRIIKYFLMSCIPLALTFSSLVFCWIFVVVYLFVILQRDGVFKVRYIVPLAIAVILFSIEDITTYFYDLNSPRMMFIIYGIKTANTFFPIGSGFATYGTEMAARYYSKLYLAYGWRNLWTLGENGQFLNDTFLAGILGQFGWIGFFLYIICLYTLYRSINTKNLTKQERILSLATVITIYVVMISSGSAKSMMGVFIFSVLGILSGKNYNPRVCKHKKLGTIR